MFPWCVSFLPPFFDIAACIFLLGCALHGSDRFVDGGIGARAGGNKNPNGNGSLYSIFAYCLTYLWLCVTSPRYLIKVRTSPVTIPSCRSSTIETTAQTYVLGRIVTHCAVSHWTKAQYRSPTFTVRLQLNGSSLLACKSGSWAQLYLQYLRGGWFLRSLFF
jgi:hypothetical protein